ASEIIGRLGSPEGEQEALPSKETAGAAGSGGVRLVLRPGTSALAQLRLERPTVAARGDRFVIRSYSPSRTIGGGVVIEPVAEKRRKHASGLDQLTVHEQGSLAARILQRLEQEKKPVSAAQLGQVISEPESDVAAALEQLGSANEVV